MDWQEAKDSTLRYWRDLRASIDRMDEVSLLKEINAVNALCEKAKEQAHGELNRCNYCIAFHQVGGCMGVSLQMSECAVDGDRDKLRELVSDFIDQLEGLEAPDAVDGSPM